MCFLSLGIPSELYNGFSYLVMCPDFFGRKRHFITMCSGSVPQENSLEGGRVSREKNWGVSANGTHSMILSLTVVNGSPFLSFPPSNTRWVLAPHFQHDQTLLPSHRMCLTEERSCMWCFIAWGFKQDSINREALSQQDLYMELIQLCLMASSSLTFEFFTDI